MIKSINYLFCTLFIIASCSRAEGVKVELLSKHFEFTGGELKENLFLPTEMERGFTLCMDVDFTIPPGMIAMVDGALRLEKSESALDAYLSLQQYYNHEEYRTQKISVPLEYVSDVDGVHEVTVQFDGALFELYVDGRLVDNDASLGYPVGCGDSFVSDAVKSIRLYSPARTPVRKRSREDDTEKYSARNIMYWTPDYYNGWVGDVVSCYYRGRYHLFYLFDRRHHGGKFGHGGHWFEHLSTADFKTWKEHETALPLDKQWMTYGTGTAFTWKDKLLITYGFHTSRFRNFDETTFPVLKGNSDSKGFCESIVATDYPKLFPEGGTYAVSSSGLEVFEPSGIFFHYSENPSVFPDPDSGGLKMYANYLANGTWIAQDIDGPWTCVDPYFPPGGDCTFPFSIGDWEYVIGGFHNMWYRSRKVKSEFVDMIPSAADLYNGISVPTMTTLPDGRCVMAGWTNNDGWAGNLVLYEVVQHPDGTLGTRWMDEIIPEHGDAIHMHSDGLDELCTPLDRNENYMLTFSSVAEENITVSFTCRDCPGEVLEWCYDPVKGKAYYVRYGRDDIKPEAYLICEGGRPEHMNNYAIKVGASSTPVTIRMMLHNEKKMTGTLVDTEIDRDKTMLDHQHGFLFDSVSFSGNIKDFDLYLIK